MTVRKQLKMILLVAAFFLFVAGVVKAHAQADFSIIAPKQGNTITFIVPSYITLTDYHTRPRATYGQGHIHLWVDQKNPTPENAIEITTNTYTLTNLKPGPHTLQAELVTNAHTSLIPKTVSTDTFTATPLQVPLSPLSLPVFQLAVFAIILIIIALYFITNHIKPNLHKKTRKRH